MFTTSLLSIAAAAALFSTVAQPVAAEPLPKGASLVKLATPLRSGMDPVLDGRIWHCDGDTCRAGAFSTASARSLVNQCGDVAHKLGPVALFQVGDEVVSDEDLARCNAQARH
jgi:hypothetical protein